MAYKFNSNCTDCEKCVEKCPVSAIMVKKDEGHLHCEVDSGLCIDCDVCGKLCEKAAVIDNKGALAEYVPEEQWPVAQIDYDSCTGCMICIEACPEYIMALSKPMFEGDLQGVALLLEPEKCTGCGICAESCPVQAIAMVKKDASSKNA